MTKLQFARTKDVDEISTILDRTISFSERGYINDNQVEEIAATIPNVEPVEETYETPYEEPYETVTEPEAVDETVETPTEEPQE